MGPGHRLPYLSLQLSTVALRVCPLDRQGGLVGSGGPCPHALPSAAIAAAPAVLLGGFWIVLAAAKALTPGPFASFVEREAGFGVGPGSSILVLVVGLEALLGLLLIAACRARFATHVRVLSLLISLGLLVWLLVHPPTRSCGCFGALGEATYGRRLLVLASMSCLAATSLMAGLRRGSKE